MILIVGTALTAVGLISMLSAEALSKIFSNPELINKISFGAKLSATFLSFLNLTVASILTFLGLEEKIVRHEQSGHAYTNLRDEAVHLAEQIRFNYEEPLLREVQRLEKKCNLLGASAPRAPLKINADLSQREKKKGTADARYWYYRFCNTNDFSNHFTKEAKDRGFASETLSLGRNGAELDDSNSS